MNNFGQRALTGAVFVGVIVTLTLINQLTFLGLMLLIGAGCLYEFYKITNEKSLTLVHYLGIITGLCIIAGKYWFKNIEMLIFSSVLFSFLAIIILFSKDKNWKTLAYTFVGIVYIAVPLLVFYISCFHRIGSGFMVITQKIYNPLLALNLFILIWCSDTFAYLCGRAFGKHPLFPAISPKKTWEGFFGGLLLTIAASYILALWFGLNPIYNLIVGFITVIFGSVGDLIESMLKRQYNVKDSGTMLPGHGGFLDRFDALLIALPFNCVVYYYLYF